MIQGNLFPDPRALRSKVIVRRKDFEALFDGFARLRAVSYVVSPDLLLEFLDRRGYSEVEVVVGDNLTETYQRTLAQKGAETAERLAECVEKGSLRIYISERTLHTKLYLLERPGQCRVIVTSANLTETARSASRQTNYAWYADLEPGHPWAARIEEDYKAHVDRCTLFMGDLAELFRKNQDVKRREIVETWLRGIPAEDVDFETRKLLREISLRAIQASDGIVEPVFSIQLPESSAARKRAERLLSPLKPVVAGGDVRINAPGYLRYVQEAHGVPILHVDSQKRELRLGIDGAIRILTETLPDAAAVDASLEHLERYFNTVDSAQAPDPRFAKVGMFEALLFLFSAPFADGYMRLKRRLYGAIDSRGPRFLYIYGPSQNGKSTFLRFVLKLIAGRSLEPLNGGDFSKRKILGAASVGTAFPLVFDDLVLAQRCGVFEEVLKSYWEVWWKGDGVSPQIVLSSNTYTLRDWAKSRVKRLDFDVHFAPGGAGKESLARLFRTDNPIFRWFSGLYFEQLDRPDPPPDDELEPARRVFEAMYRRAARPLPDYFPALPIEKLYDPGRRAWLDLLDRLRKGRVEWDRDRASVQFSDDMQHYELKEYENCLPPEVKHRRRGKALIIETPGEFRAWLDGGAAASKPWWKRLFKPTV